MATQRPPKLAITDSRMETDPQWRVLRIGINGDPRLANAAAAALEAVEGVHGVSISQACATVLGTPRALDLLNAVIRLRSMCLRLRLRLITPFFLEA